MSDSTTVIFNSQKYNPQTNPDGCNDRSYPYNSLAGDVSKSNFRLRIVSDKISNICKIVFDDTRSFNRHCGSIIQGSTTSPNQFGDFKQAYDPNTNKTENSGVGFISGYTTNASYKVYQVNNSNGNKISGSGISVRWVPSDVNSTLYCKMTDANKFKLPSENGGVFIQEYNSGSYVSWGSSIDSIITLTNVMTVSLRETINNPEDSPCHPGVPLTGYGDIPDSSLGLIPVRIVYKQKIETPGGATDPCDQFQYTGNTILKGIGYIFVKVENNSGNVILYVHLQENITINYNSNFTREEYFIESVEINSSGNPCFRYTINELNRLDVSQDENTFKRIKFKENGNFSPGYQLSFDGTFGPKVYQWSVKDLLISGQSTASFIEANIYNWVPNLSSLYIRECLPNKPFEIINGAVMQYNSIAKFGDKGINISESQLSTTLNDVRFVNLVKHIQPSESISARDQDLVYSEEKQLISSWTNGGENLIQTLSKQNNYEPGINYTPGQKVIQIHNLNSDNTIEDYKYAFGTVISWDYPDLTNPSDFSPMKLVVKMDKKGPKSPNLITDSSQYSDLEIFKVGSLVNSDQEIEFDGKIIPYNDSIFDNFTVFTDWPYEINNPGQTYFTTIKDGTIVNDAEIYSEISETPLPSTIGTTRIRCIALNPNFDVSEPYPLFKFFLFDTQIFGIGSLFGNISHISYRYDLTDTSNISRKIIEIAPISGKEIYFENIFENSFETSRTVIFEPNKDKMFINLPKPIVDTPFESVMESESLSFEIQKIYSVTFPELQNIIEIQVDSGPSPVSQESEFLTQEPGVNWFVINRKTGEAFDLYPESKSPLLYNELIYSLPQTNKLKLQRQIDVNHANNEILVIAKISVTVNSANIKTKQLINQTEFLINPLIKEIKGKYKNRYYFKLMSNTSNKGLLEKIDSIYVTDTSGQIQLGTKNIIDLFDIDYGVSDQKISRPKLILKSGYTNSNGTLKSEYFTGSENQQIDSSSINLQISYSMFKIESSAGIFSRESFKSSNNKMGINEIPFYNSPNNGNIYHYSELIDFRPSDLFDSTEKTLGNTKFVPHPDWSDSINCTFYLPRKDRLVLTKNGKIEVIYGVSSITPSFPQEPNSCMSICLLNKSPFIFNNKNVQVITLDNKRYTMKDIGNIDKRVKKLEYYTSLNLLESSSDSLLITDENGNNRFKSGILVDTFTGHGIGDVLHPDYNISIDQNENYARPPFIIHNSKLVFDSSETQSNMFVESIKPDTQNIKTGIFTFPFVNVPFVAQPLASRSISVQPHEVVIYNGEINAFPSSDLWVDQTRNPDVIVNIAGNNDAWQAITNTITNSGQGPFGVHWGNWQTIGQTTNTSIVSDQINTRRWGGLITSQITNINEQQQRTGTLTELISTEISNSLGDRITDVSIVPFMRSQTIQLIGTGLKPNTRMYVFFDEIDVSEYCFNYSTQQDMINATNGSSFASSPSSALKTTNDGKIYIRFNLPDSVFRTGERVFQVIDNSGNDKTRASTYAATKYFSNGLGVTREQTILTTRDFQIRNTDINDTRSVLVGTSSVEIERETWWTDPLAQTFLVNELLYPEGIYIKNVELFFARKPTNNENLSVSVELRPVNNGYPDSRKVYPGGISRKLAKDVNISDSPDANDTSTKTVFEFDYPIYLEPGEHSLVIRGQSEEFEVYIAELGQNIINSDVQITNQPYAGVFFTSANSSTWSAEQNIDLMMVLNKCEFTKNITYYLPVKNQLSTTQNKFETLFLQSNFMEFNSCRVSWSTKLFPHLETAEQFSIIPNVDTRLTKQFEYGMRSDNFEVPAKFMLSAKTINSDVCPVIDLERLGFIAINNRIEFDDSENNGEISPYADYPTGIPRSRYISRIVTLEQGFESNNCKVILTINKPKNSNIQVFGKFQSAYDTGDFHNRNYIKLIPQNSQVFNSFESQRDNEWREFTFNLPNETEEPFNKFCIKICLYSTDFVNIPKIKNMRAITII